MRYLFAALLLISTCSFDEQVNCRKIRNGKFSIADDSGQVWTLIRNGNIQTEENKELGLKFSFQVKWLGDCTYILSNPKLLKGDAKFALPKSLIVTTEVLNVTGKFYKARFKANVNDLVRERDIRIL